MTGFINLQTQQYEHDLNFHGDIIILSTQDRIKHLALHFAKYVGKLYETPDESKKIKIYIDIFICCLSLANVLNVKLEVIDSADNKNNGDFLKEFSISLGHIAKACEALDHLEAFPYKETITFELTKIFTLILDVFKHLNMDLQNQLNHRWREIEQKSIFAHKEPTNDNSRGKSMRPSS